MADNKFSPIYEIYSLPLLLLLLLGLVFDGVLFVLGLIISYSYLELSESDINDSETESEEDDYSEIK